MGDRKTITVSEAAWKEAKEKKGDRTWDDLVRDGARAETADETDDEWQSERHPQPLTADDVPMLRREIVDELENRMTRR
jgi:hypothetical protein